MKKSVHSKAQRRLTESLVKARKDAGLTQQELADRLGKHQSFVAKYENGERRLDVVEFLVIARHIGTDPQKILSNLASLLE